MVPSSQSGCPHKGGSISVVLVTGWRPALAESTEQCALPSSWHSVLLPHLWPHASAPFLNEDLLPRILLCSEWISWQAANLSVSCQKWGEHSGPYPLLFIMCVGVRQSQRGCWGQSSEHTWPPGRGLCRTAPRGWEWASALNSCRWWGCQGDRLWEAVFFVFQIGWGFSFIHWNSLEKNATGRVAGIGALVGKVLFPIVLRGASKRGWVLKRLELCTQFGVYGWFLGQKLSTFYMLLKGVCEPIMSRTTSVQIKSISKLFKMNQFFVLLRKRRFSHSCCLSLPLFSSIPDVVFKGCVHIENKYISKILLSWLPFTMGTYLNPKLSHAENMHFFYLLKFKLISILSPPFLSCGRNLISMFGIFYFFLCPRGLCVNSGALT